MATRLEAVSNIADISVPAFVAQNESAKIRISLYGTGAALTTYAVYIVSPDGQAVDYVSSFRDVSAAVPFTFISIFEFEYTFRQAGHYTFLMHESGSGSVWTDKTFAAQWATNMDAKISDIKKQRTDLERIYNRVNRG